MFGLNRLSVAELLLNYMKEKYQEEFTPGFCEEANWAYSCDSMTVYSDKFPKEFIQAYRYKNKEFKDNYISYLYRDEVEKLVQEVCEPLFGKCKVINHISLLPVDPDLPKEATLMEYLKNQQPDNQVSIYIEKYDATKDYMEIVEKMTVQFRNKLLPGIIDFYFINEDKVLDAITRDTEKAIMNEADDDLWFVKEVHLCYEENYEFDRADLRKDL